MLSSITVHGWDLDWASVLRGISYGLGYSVVAAGIILIYRASGVINFAIGAIGVFGTSLMAVQLGHAHFPFLLALPLTAIACGMVGAIAEFAFVRRLFEAPRLVLLLATLGMAQVITLCAILLPDLEIGGPYPTMLPWSWRINESVVIEARHFSLFLTAPGLIIGLGLFLTKTRWGLMVRASASNADKSRMNGIRVRRTSTMVWALAGSFVGITSVVLAPMQDLSLATALTPSGQQSGGMEMLVRALLVCLIARMASLPLTIVGGITVGIVEQIIWNNVDPTSLQAVYLAFFLGTVFLVFTFKKRSRGSGGGDDAWKVAPKVKDLPENVKAVWWMRHLPKAGLSLVLVFLAFVPVLFNKPSQVDSWTRVTIFAIIGCSLTVLTGWGGQLSLGQFGFVALGALTTLSLTQGGQIPTPFGWGTNVHLDVAWGIAVIISIAGGALLALLVGLPALRIPGLFLAIISLAFSVFMSVYVLSRPVFLPAAGYFEAVAKPIIGPFDFNSRKSYYYLCLIALLIVLVLVSQLRRTGIGRSIVAVRTNESAAAAMTISPARMKLLAFGLSGAISAFAGAMYVTLLISFNPLSFSADDSVRAVSIAVIGGLGSIAGPVLGSLWIVGIPAVTGGSAESGLLVSGIGLLILLMYFPGGFVQLGYAIRDALAGYVSSKLPVAEGRQRSENAAVPARIDVKASKRVDDLEFWIRTTDVRVNFGGRVAVDDVSLTVRPREFVGLIGTNGAGKSTLMNAISGFVPSKGRIEVLGHDVAHLSAPGRHRLGLGRGFQAARLYDDLTVRETILVALEAHERSLFLPSLLHVAPSPGMERRKRKEADEVISYLGLGRFANQFISNLSTGTRRVTELACQLAIGPRVLLLDEPTGGLAQRETEAFGPLIKQIQKELDAAVLLIEHDMPLVMSISDRVYCLEAGGVISEGPPDLVRHDPRVIASYLGTDERTIERSNAGQAPAPVEA
jgi:ABC-type branched-subunit amino acid transport system ATPase component/ABC-type branched-subunit amino acid transport system permease subunit